jgi:hypothetical protein
MAAIHDLIAQIGDERQVVDRRSRLSVERSKRRSSRGRR